jgi:hypothetical protein
MVSASGTAVVFRAQHALHAPCQLEWDAGKSVWPTMRTRGETMQVISQGSALPHSWTRPRSKGGSEVCTHTTEQSSPKQTQVDSQHSERCCRQHFPMRWHVVSAWKAWKGSL